MFGDLWQLLVKLPCTSYIHFLVPDFFSETSMGMLHFLCQESFFLNQVRFGS